MKTPWSLRVGLIGLAFALVSLVVILAHTQLMTTELLFTRDPSTGRVLEQLSTGQRDATFSTLYTYGPLLFWMRKLLLVVVLNLALIFVGLRRSSRGRSLRLPLVFVCLAAPLVLGLVAATYLDDVLGRDLLRTVHAWFSSVELHRVPTCVGDLVPCSLLLGLDSAAKLVGLLISASVALGLALGAWLSWRAGERGARLRPGWSRSAVACFVLGALALVATRAHRVDRQRMLAACTEQPRPMWRDLPSTWIDRTPDELRGVDADACLRDVGGLDLYAPAAVGRYQLSEAGELSHLKTLREPDLCIPEAALLAELESAVAELPARAKRYGEVWDPTIELYVDARTPTTILAATLERLYRADVSAVVLLGSAVASGEFVTVGPWERRLVCPLGRLVLDPSSQAVEEFETVTELANAAAGGLQVSPSRVSTGKPEHGCTSRDGESRCSL